MGYTHYWERPRILPRPQFIAAVADCRHLCDALDIPLGGANGEGPPHFSDDDVCFNGHVDSGRLMSVQPATRSVVSAGVLGRGGDGSCETFYIERTSRSRTRYELGTKQWCGGFCKTNQKPYDLCVQGCLIVLNHRLGNDHFRVGSDGESQQWNDARDACQHILGYGIDWGEDKLAPLTSPPPAH